MSKKNIGCLTLTSMLVVRMLFAAQPDLQIAILSVGQADAQMIFTKEKTLIIDVGGQVIGLKKQYEYVYSKLKELTGKDFVDYFVVTHYHTDHVGNRYHNSETKGFGLWGLIVEKGVRIGTLVDRGDDVNYGTSNMHENYLPAVSRWLTEGKILQRVTAQLGSDQIDLGNNVTLDIVGVNGNGVLDSIMGVNPSRFENHPPSENDYSIALRTTLGDFEYFTGGDLSGQFTVRDFPNSHYSDNDIESSIANRVGDIEVYRVNHHGSAYSSNQFFVSKLDPEFSLISSGENNTYGHPDPKVCELLVQTSRVFITSGVSQKTLSEFPAIGSSVVGDILVKVFDGGRKYTITDDRHGTTQAKSFNDEEEASGKDGDKEIAATTPLQLVTPSEAVQYVGQEVTVRGKIISVKKLSKIAFLNFSYDYTTELSLVVFQSNFSRFTEGFEPYVDKIVEVQGKVELYNGRPQMKVDEPSAIRVLQ